jgi:hypothetical protein
VAAIDRILADDLVGTNPFGVSYDQAGLIGQIKSQAGGEGDTPSQDA